MVSATITEAELQRLERVVDVSRKLRAARETLREWQERRTALLEVQQAEVTRLEKEFADARAAVQL